MPTIHFQPGDNRREWPAQGVAAPRTEAQKRELDLLYKNVPNLPSAPAQRKTISDVDQRLAQARAFANTPRLRYEPHPDRPGGRVTPIVRQPQQRQPQPAKSDAWRATLDEKFGKPAVDAELHRLGEFEGKPVDERNRDVICTHEACHAIVADAIGMPVRKLAATLDKSGYVMPDLAALKVKGGEWRESLLRYGSYMLAGIVGEEIKFGSRQTFDRSDDGDEAQLAKFVNVFFADKEGRAAFYAEVRAFARRALTERWSDVERVAAALRERGSMSGDEFRKLVPATQVRRVQLPMATRSAAVQGASGDEFDVVFSAGATVRRRDQYGEAYDEELLMGTDNVDLSRLASGTAPFLSNHDATDIRSVLGVVTNARIENGIGLAHVRLSNRDDVQPIAQDLRDKILRNVSVGYAVVAAQRVQRSDDVPLLRVTRWRPAEVSLVPIGADPDARVRTFEAEISG